MQTFKITIKAGHPYVGIGEGKIVKEGLTATSMRELLVGFGIIEDADLHGVGVDEYPVDVEFKMTECDVQFPHDPTVQRDGIV